MKKQNIDIQDNQEDQFPGYPLYPASEDIMTRGERVGIDADGIPETKTTEPLGVASLPVEAKPTLNTIEPAKMRVEGNNTQEQEADNDTQSADGDYDDEELKDRVYPVDFTGEDLDVPGSELDDVSEETGNEENNSYSLGNLD